ncbi:unnamed protein product, partial [Heterosigma akashiwo]
MASSFFLTSPPLDRQKVRNKNRRCILAETIVFVAPFCSNKDLSRMHWISSQLYFELDQSGQRVYQGASLRS